MQTDKVSLNFFNGRMQTGKVSLNYFNGHMQTDKVSLNYFNGILQTDGVFLKNCTIALFCAIFALKSPVFTVLNGSSLQYRLKYDAALMVLIVIGCAY
jgi:hypothetical protein